MQVIFKNKDERSYSKEANSVDTIICACYVSMLEVLSKELTLVLSGIRELDREFFYKLVYLI